jgi:hypothetical protein
MPVQSGAHVAGRALAGKAWRLALRRPAIAAF